MQLVFCLVWFCLAFFFGYLEEIIGQVLSGRTNPGKKCQHLPSFSGSSGEEFVFLLTEFCRNCIFVTNYLDSLVIGIQILPDLPLKANKEKDETRTSLQRFLKRVGAGGWQILGREIE